MKKLAGIIVGIVIGLSLGTVIAGPGAWQNSAEDCWGKDSIQTYIDKYENSTSNNIVVYNSSGVRAEVAMSGDATISTAGALTIAGFSASTFIGSQVQTATGGVSLAITPTKSLIHLHASANATNTIVAPGTAGLSIGDDLLIVNVLAQTVVFADGTPLQLSATLTLGQYDTLLLTVVSSTEYAEVSTSNN